MRRLLLGVCLLLLAGCGASPSATSTGSPATSAPTSAPPPTPAVSPTPSCATAVMHHQPGELVTTANWQITLTSIANETTDTAWLDVVFTFKNTTSNEVNVGAGSTGDPYIFSFGMLDSTLSNPLPEVNSNANPTSVPAGGTTTFTLSYQVTNAQNTGQGYILQVVANPPGCVYGGWDIGAKYFPQG